MSEPDYVRKGVLLHVTIDGDTCVMSPCVDSNGRYIIYDGVEYSTTEDDGAAAFGDDLLRQIYYDNPYDIEQGSFMTVTPPVNVPIWVGVY